MKGSFTAPAGALVPAVKYAARWLDTKPSSPVLGGMVFDVADGTLTIATQGELATARAVVDVQGDASGRFIVSGRLVDALVATLADKPVTFTQKDTTVDMTAGRYSASLPAMSENDYPGLADLVPTVGRIEGAALIDAVRRVGAMASRDASNRISLTGIYFWFEEDELTMSGTDSLRASRETVEWKADGESAPVAESFVLPASVMTDAGDAFAGLEMVEIGWDSGSVSLATSARSLVTRTLGRPDDFPDLGGLFGQFDARTHTATVGVKDVMVPLKRADQLADGEHRHVAIDLRANTLILRSATEGKGNGGEEIDIEYDGPDCTIMTRSAILHGLLATAPGDTVTLHLTPGTYTSVFATSPANPAWKHLFMPIRHAS
jgi:DNA polymerase-3 subunit beta